MAMVDKVSRKTLLLEKLLAFDREEIPAAGGGWLAGVDEAGRGPLAGPVVAAAVILVSPEILAGSMQEPSIRRAARWADGLCGFSLGPDPDEVERCFDVARASWSAAGREAPPRLVTSCWFSLGAAARARMDAYVERYLGVFGPDIAKFLARQCRTTSADALREVARRTAAAGGDELVLVPTTSDPAEVERAADVLAGIAQS